MNLDEEKLLEAFIKGDEQAFSQLFQMYYDDACRYIIRIIRDQDTAEEIAQATFVNLWEKRDLIKADVSFKSYLFRSVYNTALNYLKHQKVVATYVSRKQENIDVAKKSYVSHQPDFELQKRIDDALESLPPQCQRVFRLSREDGMKYHEIADELGISKKTVEVHMGKALRILRDHLSDYLTIFVFLTLFNIGV
ncbi:RNA polymerase sigma-70 factor [Roseivirga pacifica]|uniref:RNA polymerase sigma-70 factor n=1 Tax=Roseivirga pacifica TaxID=1267423 RepID=UPI0020960E14|nr:RNA polymerase sigma-70 factor [Roseivirga pacifica]